MGHRRFLFHGPLFPCSLPSPHFHGSGLQHRRSSGSYLWGLLLKRPCARCSTFSGFPPNGRLTPRTAISDIYGNGFCSGFSPNFLIPAPAIFGSFFTGARCHYISLCQLTRTKAYYFLYGLLYISLSKKSSFCRGLFRQAAATNQINGSWLFCSYNYYKKERIERCAAAVSAHFIPHKYNAASSHSLSGNSSNDSSAKAHCNTMLGRGRYRRSDRYSHCIFSASVSSSPI